MPKMPQGGRPGLTPLVRRHLPPRMVDLTRDGLRIRTLRPEAVTPDIARWLTDPAVMEGLNAPKASMPIEAFQAYVANFDNIRRSIMLIMEEKEEKPLGLIFLELDLRHRSGSLHLIIGSEDDRGNKLAFEAAAIACYHAFKQRDVEKLTFQPLERNGPAIAVCEKSGLRLEGVLRSHRIDGRTGERLDQRVYGLTRQEYDEMLARRLAKGGSRPVPPGKSTQK